MAAAETEAAAAAEVEATAEAALKRSIFHPFFTSNSFRRIVRRIVRRGVLTLSREGGLDGFL